MTQESDKNALYFTIIPSNAGFTDQLLQFGTYYKLGLSLGYTYTHSTFVNTRPGAEEIFDFLGFNERFSDVRLTRKDQAYRWMGMYNRFYPETRTWRNRLRQDIPFWLLYTTVFREFNFIDIGLGESAPLDENKDPVEALRDLIRDTVEKHRSTDPRRKNVVRFYLTGGKLFFERIAPHLNQQTPRFPGELALRDHYFRHAQDQARETPFQAGGVRTLVHIRLGDTAIVETPWHTFVPLWDFWMISPLKEHADKSDPLFKKLMDVEDFAGFLEKFRAHFEPGALSTAVFSDGYKTAFKDVFAHLDDLHLPEDRVRALEQSALTYEQAKFAAFDDMENCVSRVGETNEDLKALIDATLHADVLIVGCHQRMLPKFLSTYYDTNGTAQTIIIALHNGYEPRYALEIGLDESKASVFPINLAEGDYSESLRRAVDAIKQRHPQAAGSAAEAQN